MFRSWLRLRGPIPGNDAAPPFITAIGKLDTLTTQRYPGFIRAVLLGLLLLATMPGVRADTGADLPQMRALFPAADRVDESAGDPPARAVYANGELIGYAFFTADMVRIPAYSGSPIDILVGIGTDGRIAGARIVRHEEPILAAGISEARLAEFVDQYRGKPATGRMVVGAAREGYAEVDAISGATISVMVINASIARAVRMVAESRGIRPSEAAAPPASAAPPAAMPARMAAPPLRSAAAPAANAPAAAGPAATPPAQPALAPAESRGGPSRFAMPPDDEEPMWRTLWQQRKVEIALLVPGLFLLTCILLFQDYLARRPSLLRRVRLGFLVYTLFFIGGYALGQLSIINVLTFVQAVTNQFSWDTFLVDPMLFILWSFVAVTLLLWGRGVYCGWLCPFGALQELGFQFARRLKLPSFEIPHVVHERMLALKFVILLVLLGLSLQSMGMAMRAAEIEPFKTVFALHFQREWRYVAFALGVLLLSALNRKFYCKYLCPLGASLVIPGRFHSFEWLRRRKECGKPCQACAVECEVQAIRPTGEIVVNECHHCLDCQVTYYSDRKCPPLIEKRKRRERVCRARNPAPETAAALAAARLDRIPVAVNPDRAEHAGAPGSTDKAQPLI